MNKNVLLLLCLLFAWGTMAAEPVNLWSGRSQNLPGTGQWVLAAEHGRVLGSGSGEARFDIPALADGATLDAVLTRDGQSQKVRFHAPKPLAGVVVRRVRNDKAAQRLEALGAKFSVEKPGVELRFLEKYDFPFRLNSRGDDISLCRAKNPGTLGVLLNRNERTFDLDGDFSYAVLRNQWRGKTVMTVLFPPEFDLDNIENVLLVKKFLKENEK